MKLQVRERLFSFLEKQVKRAGYMIDNESARKSLARRPLDITRLLITAITMVIAMKLIEVISTRADDIMRRPVRGRSHLFFWR